MYTSQVSSEYKLVDQPVLLTILTYEILHLVEWWTTRLPDPYNTDKGQIWLFEIIN